MPVSFANPGNPTRLLKPMNRFLTGALILLGAGSSSLALADDKPKPYEDAAFIAKSARTIDTFVAAWYHQEKMEVPQVTDDATFLRRAFLVTVGRIPTGEEARAFLEIESPTKRKELIDYLIKSPGYSSAMSNWAFDLFRVTDRKSGFNASFDAYRNWIRQAIDSDMPWDELTNRLLSSQGDGWSKETAAVGYYVRDRGMPLDNLANSMRVFLGSRMECAQCHDDPFGGPERIQFYELAAFTAGQQTFRQDNMKNLWEGLEKGDQHQTLDYSVAQVMWDKVYGLSLGGEGDGQIKLPEDFKDRKDGKPGDLIGGKTPFGKTMRTSEHREDGKGRIKLAEWVTGRTGDQFPSVIANRMWKQVMGRGVYEPIDDYKEAKDLQNPQLMAYLISLMGEVNYDLRAYQKILLNTKTFQFMPNPQPSKVATGDDFHGRQLQRLSAEQIWDSLITLSGGDPDKKPRRTLDDRIYVNGKPVLVGKKNMEQLSQEVLALKNEKEVKSYYEKFLKQVRDEGAAGKGDEKMMNTMMASVQTYDSKAEVRASELPSPAPREHLLYLFGQSDREIVEGASRDPNVGQVLALMNGYVQAQLVNNPNAALYKGLDQAGSDKEKIRRLYLAIFSRPPTDEEMGWMLDEVKASGKDGYRNIVSALVMSSEFLFVQ
jgi:hypothetical protein